LCIISTIKSLTYLVEISWEELEMPLVALTFRLFSLTKFCKQSKVSTDLFKIKQKMRFPYFVLRANKISEFINPALFCTTNFLQNSRYAKNKLHGIKNLNELILMMRLF